MNELPASVLVADDSLTIATALSICLRRAGFQVTTTHSGEEALSAANTATFDLVISDQQMLEMSGADLCLRLRCDPRYTQTPFVLLTASSELDTDQLIAECGISCVCAKPFSPAEVVKMAKDLTMKTATA